MLITSSV